MFQLSLYKLIPMVEDKYPSNHGVDISNWRNSELDANKPRWIDVFGALSHGLSRELVHKRLKSLCAVEFTSTRSLRLLFKAIWNKYLNKQQLLRPEKHQEEDYKVCGRLSQSHQQTKVRGNGGCVNSSYSSDCKTYLWSLLGMPAMADSNGCSPVMFEELYNLTPAVAHFSYPRRSI